MRDTEEENSTRLPGSDGEHQAQRRFGSTARALAFYNKQVLDHLNPSMREFIAAQEMAFIATADAHGKCDCSFRAGPPGFVHVFDDRTLAFPQYRGNGVLASVGNIMENAHVGMLFMDFVRDTVGLHVNGRARIVDNGALPAQPDGVPQPAEATGTTTAGRCPECWIFVDVEEAYIHCSKHIPLMARLDKDIHWGTDDHVRKGGDAFKAKDCPRPWGNAVDASAPRPTDPVHA